MASTVSIYILPEAASHGECDGGGEASLYAAIHAHAPAASGGRALLLRLLARGLRSHPYPSSGSPPAAPAAVAHAPPARPPASSMLSPPAVAAPPALL